MRCRAALPYLSFAVFGLALLTPSSATAKDLLEPLSPCEELLVERLYYLKDERVFRVPPGGKFADSWNDWIDTKLNFQDVIQASSLPKDIQARVRFMREKSLGAFPVRSYDSGVNTYSAADGVRRGDRLPFLVTKFREMGFVVLEMQDGTRRVAEVTSNLFMQINRTHLLKAVDGIWPDSGNGQEVVKFSLFHTHPPRSWHDQEQKGLSEGDLAEVLWMRAYLKEKKGVAPEVSIYASEISDDGDELYRFVLRGL